MSTPNDDGLENKNSNAIGRKEGEEEHRHEERRTESDRKHDPGSKNWDRIERRITEDHRWKGRRGHKRRSRHSHHRWRKLKKTSLTLLAVVGVSFLAALFLTYITGSLPNLVEKIIARNMEKALQRTTAEFTEGKFNLKSLEGLSKNIDIEKLKGQAMRNIGGLEGDRGGKQSPDEYKGQEDYLKSMSRDDLEKNKDYYKEKYKEFLQK